MPLSYIIRPERAADAAAIHRLIELAFKNAPHTNHKEQHIVDILRREGQLSLSLLAEKDGRCIGHAALSPVQIADGAENWSGLGPVAVEPACQRQGIGAKLINSALDWLRDSGGQGCVVLGEPSYYQRFGFKNEAGLTLADVPPAYFMALRLKGAVPQGEVRYQPAFYL